MRKDLTHVVSDGVVPKRGKVTIPTGLKPYQHELETVARLVAAGHNGEFLVPSLEKGVKTPDILLDGVRGELKSPVGAGKNTIDHQLSRGKTQSDLIILDTARTALSDESVIASVRKRVDLSSRISEVMVVTKSGLIVYIVRD